MAFNSQRRWIGAACVALVGVLTARLTWFEPGGPVQRVAVTEGHAVASAASAEATDRSGAHDLSRLVNHTAQAMQGLLSVDLDSADIGIPLDERTAKGEPLPPDVAAQIEEIEAAERAAAPVPDPPDPNLLIGLLAGIHQSRQNTELHHQLKNAYLDAVMGLQGEERELALSQMRWVLEHYPKLVEVRGRMARAAN